MTGSDRRSRELTIAAEARQIVRSPEQVELQLPIAGPTSRMLAYAVDQAVIWTVEIGILVAVLLSSQMPGWLANLIREAGDGLVDPGAQTTPNAALLMLLGLFVIAQLVIDVGYFTACELAWAGQSIGKRLLKLRVVRDGGVPLATSDSLVRNLLRAVDVLPANYLVGLVAMILSPDGKRLGDLAAGTVVIRLDRTPSVEPLALDGTPDDPAFRFDRSHVAALGERERALLRQTLRRVGDLSPERARELTERTSEALRRRIGYPPVAEADRLAFLRALLRAATRGL